MARPMWTPEHRRAANRKGPRYPSDLTDDEWALVAPMIPPAPEDGARRMAHRDLEIADREAIRRGRLRGFAQAMDCRTHLCLDQSQPPLGSHFERYTTTVAAFVRLAMIRIMLKRLAATASS